MKTYKILNSFDNMILTFIVKEIGNKVTEYCLYCDGKDDEQILILSAIDDEDGFMFGDTLNNKMEYHDVDYLHLFLNLIKKVDDRLFDSYIMTEPIGQI